MEVYNKPMEKQNNISVVKALYIGWSIFYFLYALLGVWLGTGKYALAGPQTSLGDYMFAGVWLGFSIVQVVIAVMAAKRPERWLTWTSTAFAIVSVCMVVAPLVSS
jgi:hypothetical protein